MAKYKEFYVNGVRVENLEVETTFGHSKHNGAGKVGRLIFPNIEIVNITHDGELSSDVIEQEKAEQEKEPEGMDWSALSK